MPVEITGTDFLTEIEEDLGVIIRSEFSLMGMDLQKYIRDFAPEYTGAYRTGIGQVVEGSGLGTTLTVFDDAPTAIFTEYGRRPGKQPPPPVMLAWVQFKGLAETVIGQPGFSKDLLTASKQLAFLIGRAIGLRGLPGVRLFETLPEAMAWLIDSHTDRLEERVNLYLNGGS